jgi:hypothetical protein
MLETKTDWPIDRQSQHNFDFDWFIVESVESCSCVLEAGSWDREQFENPPLEAATKQRLVKTSKTLCVLYLQWCLECVTQCECRSYL